MIIKCKICGGHGFTTTCDVFGSVFGQNRKPCPACSGAGEFDLNVPEDAPSPPDKLAKNGIASKLNGLIVPVASGISTSSVIQYPAIVLVTVNDNETHALLDAFLGEGKTAAPITIGGVTYNELGTHGCHRLINTVCEMGAGGIGASQQRTRQAIEHWQPCAIIAVGIAFGLDETKQHIGDVLVSTQIQDYELGRLNEDGTLTPRGDKPSSADVLRNRLRQSDITERRHQGSAWPTVHFGLVLSGHKLVDNLDYSKSLKGRFPNAIGGEMEGIGLYVSASEAKVDWIVVKAICDWGHNKNQAYKDAWQRLAAKNAARVLKSAIVVGSLYSSEHPNLEDSRSKSSIGPVAPIKGTAPLMVGFDPIIGLYCKRCGAFPSEQPTSCTGAYSNHDFVPLAGQVFCRRCGVAPGVSTMCTGAYSNHDFIPV